MMLLVAGRPAVRLLDCFEREIVLQLQRNLIGKCICPFKKDAFK